VEAGHGDQLLRWGFRLIEYTFQSMKKTPGGKHQCLAIFDLQHITYYQACHIPCKLIIVYSRPSKTQIVFIDFTFEEFFIVMHLCTDNIDDFFISKFYLYII
jgi:hypothetical protein